MDSEPLLQVVNLRKFFPVRLGFFESIFTQKRKQFIKAVDGITFKINSGKTLGLVGESGCGKTTVGMLISLLETLTEGKIIFENKNIMLHSKKEKIKFRRSVQNIFQDPYESLDPRLNVFDTICEPLVINKIGASKNERVKLVKKMLEEVELRPVEIFLNKYPNELSGGQRQRVAMARAMILNPKLIVADEPVSMLDASVKVSMMNLMSKLKKNFNSTYLFITHDLSVARYMCDRIAIMYLGVFVEIGPTEEIITNPIHPYTNLLLSSVPIPDPLYKRQRNINTGEVPSPINLPSGCRFWPRCPNRGEKCTKTEPQLEKVRKKHFVACYYK